MPPMSLPLAEPIQGWEIFLEVDSQNAVTMHDFFHVWRRDEIAFLGVNFQEAKTFVGPFNDAFNAWCLGVQLLF